MRILIVEDDREVAGNIAKMLRESGHVVDAAHDGEDGLAMARDGAFDVLIVDRMMPRRDGLSMISILREEGDKTPALVLSAMGEVDDRVAGLTAGGDDYLVKPYAPSELKARVDALARRRDPDALKTRLQVGDLEMDLLARTVKRGEEAIQLQPREFRLLEFLMRHADQVVTRTMLLEGVWDYHFDPQTNVVDVLVHRLRTKIDKNFPQKLLHTIRGVGYVLKVS